MLKYRNNDVADLAHQLALSPKHLRLKQLGGADRLLAMVSPEKSYPFDLVRFHITGTKPINPDEKRAVSGTDLLADLPTLAEHVTRKAAISMSDLTGQHQTLDELAANLQVSTKTIRRWRKRGLMGFRAAIKGSVTRLVFSEAAIERFRERNKDTVERGASFKLLTEAEKQNIIDIARAILMEKREKLHNISRKISEQTGRAVETIRYTLRQYDLQNPNQPLFARGGEPAVNREQLAIWRCRHRGESVEQIAEAFGMNPVAVEAVLRELEARQLKQETWEYVDNELFHAPNAKALILDVPRPAAEEPSGRKLKTPKGAPAYVRALYEIPLLSREQEADLFRRYNYLRFSVAQAIEKLDPYSASRRELDKIHALQAAAEGIKNEIIQANLRLVVSVAKRHANRSESFFETVSDGNVTLMRAVDNFDYSLGYKFSTYSCWSLMRNYARSVPENHYHQRRYVTGQDELLDCAPDAATVETSTGDMQAVRDAINEGIEQLNTRERTIVKAHFGLCSADGATETLEELGRRFGVTKERVRQIERKAIEKLREVISPNLIDAFAD